jgi:hypothetical protein
VLLARDPTICGSCNSIYTDNYKVLLFNQSGTLLRAVSETNYLYYNMFSSSHGIGAGSVSISVPAGATTLEIQSQLYIAGLLGSDGLPLNSGQVAIGSEWLDCGHANSDYPPPVSHWTRRIFLARRARKEESISRHGII